jgi:hypothetical protein
MKIISDYTPKHREYFKVRIIDRKTSEAITIVKIGKNDSISEAIRNIAGNMGYLRSEITYEFV